MARHRPGDFLRRAAHRDPADGAVLSRALRSRRRSAAPSRMRAALASAGAGRIAQSRAHPARRLLRDRLLSRRYEEAAHGRHGRGVARLRPALLAAAPSVLADGAVRAEKSLVRSGFAAGAEEAGEKGARALNHEPSIRSISSSEKPKWWPISW